MTGPPTCPPFFLTDVHPALWSNPMVNKANPEESLERLLSPQEVMRSLQVGRSKFYLMVASGELPAVRFGRMLRFRPQDVQALIEKRAAQAQKPKAHTRKKGQP